MTVRVMCAKSRPLVMPRNCPDRRPGDAHHDHQHHHRHPGDARCDFYITTSISLGYTDDDDKSICGKLFMIFCK